MSLRPSGCGWLRIWSDLGKSPHTIAACGRGLEEFLGFCDRARLDPREVKRGGVASYVRELMTRPHRNGVNVVSMDSGAGMSNATLQQRLVPVRLFFDFLVARHEALFDRAEVEDLRRWAVAAA